MGLLDTWRRRVRQLKLETYALYLAYRDPRVPWYARLVAAAVVAYALSPIDLIPDFVPILGYLDDLVLVPLGLALALRLVPPDLLAECRERAAVALQRPGKTSWLAASVIVALWLLGAALLGLLVWRALWR
jgi:uncharacterized membrane protein YkvA (DUF1232 family)